MKRTMWSVIVAVVLAVAAFSFADAQGRGQRGPRPDGGPGFGRGGPGGFARVADLTDEQKKQVQAILEEERSSREGPPASMTIRRQLDAEILSDSPDEQKIDTLRLQLVQAHGEELSRQIAVQRKIAQVLTVEQRATARERLDKPRGRGF
ncbi:MAG: Spy/CpxP family protein refolding chaperone [Vicinamibacterales bacterium]